VRKVNTNTKTQGSNLTNKRLNPDQIIRIKLQEIRLKESFSSPWQKFQLEEHPDLIKKLTHGHIPEWTELLESPSILEIYNQSDVIQKIRSTYEKN
jgi:hypothetical protein